MNNNGDKEYKEQIKEKINNGEYDFVFNTLGLFFLISIFALFSNINHFYGMGFWQILLNCLVYSLIILVISFGAVLFCNLVKIIFSGLLKWYLMQEHKFIIALIPFTVIVLISTIIVYTSLY
jgi:hypothetical protein